MQFDDIKWFHSIELSGGITPGFKSNHMLKFEADLYYRSDLVPGKSVLDIGAWDGFMSFEAERRGASRVVASDYFCWGGPGWGTKQGFDFAKSALGSNVEELEADVFALDPKKHGTFDIVLMPGVIYHLTDPWGGLKKAADLTHDLLIIETATSMNHCLEPVMQYWPGDSLGGDNTNFWTQNAPCLRGMLSDIGFSRIETILHDEGSPRLIAHAWR